MIDYNNATETITSTNIDYNTITNTNDTSMVTIRGNDTEYINLYIASTDCIEDYTIDYIAIISNHDRNKDHWYVPRKLGMVSKGIMNRYNSNIRNQLPRKIRKEL